MIGHETSRIRSAGLALLGIPLAVCSIAHGTLADVRVVGAQQRGIDLLARVSRQGSPTDTEQATRLADPNDPGLFSEILTAVASAPALGATRARGAHESSLVSDPAAGGALRSDVCGWGDLASAVSSPGALSSSDGQARSFYQLDLEVRDEPAPFELRLSLLSGLDRLEGPGVTSLIPEASVSLEELDLGLRVVDAELTDATADRMVVDRARRLRGTLLPGRYRLSAHADVGGEVQDDGRGAGFSTFVVSFAVPEPNARTGLLGSLLALMAVRLRRGRTQSRSSASRVRASCSW